MIQVDNGLFVTTLYPLILVAEMEEPPLPLDTPIEELLAPFEDLATTHLEDLVEPQLGKLVGPPLGNLVKPPMSPISGVKKTSLDEIAKGGRYLLKD